MSDADGRLSSMRNSDIGMHGVGEHGRFDSDGWSPYIRYSGLKMDDIGECGRAALSIGEIGLSLEERRFWFFRRSFLFGIEGIGTYSFT